MTEAEQVGILDSGETRQALVEVEFPSPGDSLCQNQVAEKGGNAAFGHGMAFRFQPQFNGTLVHNVDLFSACFPSQ